MFYFIQSTLILIQKLLEELLLLHLLVIKLYILGQINFNYHSMLALFFLFFLKQIKIERLN